MSEVWSEHISPGVRLYQRSAGSPITLSIILANGKKSRRSLGHADHERARREALQVGSAPSARVAQPGAGAAAGGSTPLTLADLCTRFSLSAQAQQRIDYPQVKARLGFVVAAIGVDKTVEGLVPEDIDGYAHTRGKVVRPNTVRSELAIFKAACRWAVKNRLAAGQPFGAVRLDRDMNPVRPLLSNAEIDHLVQLAGPMQKRLLLLARDTGRRLRALRLLTWERVNLKTGEITWTADTDKTRRVATVPMTDRLWAFLKTVPTTERVGFVVRAGGKKPTDAIVTTTAERWLNDLLKQAKIPKPDRGGWHMFRRRWATDRGKVPLKMAMDAGGWRSVAVFVETYQRSDEAGLRAAMNAPVSQQYDTGTVSRADTRRTHKKR